MSDLSRPPVTPQEYGLTRRLLSHILHRVRPCDRDDVFHSALARALTSWDPQRGSWGRYVYHVAAGELRDYWRARRPDCALLDDLMDTDCTHAREAAIDLMLLLRQLRPAERRALLARRGGRTAHTARLRLRRMVARDAT